MTLLILSLVAAIGCGKDTPPAADTAEAPAEGQLPDTTGADPGGPSEGAEPDGDVDDEADEELSIADADGDGYDSSEDCDDGDPGVHPGAEELCDGRDQDCDGLSDEAAVDAPTWYLDADGDGSGDPAITAVSCEEPPGYVAEGEADCDDGDPGVYPGAEEVCDGRDQDCDGAIDDEAVDALSWYIDVDGDGYGSPGPYDATACTAPDGYVAASVTQQDCDDRDPESYPGAEELCDGADNNCDGSIDNEPVDGESWYADADADGYGDPDDAVSACEAPPGRSADGSDCDDGDAASYPGAEELCDGADNDCDGEADEDAVDAASWYLDEDGDGYGLVGYQREGCEQPAGYAAERGDCDDEDSGRSPGLSEVCGDGLDNDCSDETSCRLEGVLDGGDSDIVLTGASADDDFGAVLGAVPGALMVQAPGRSSAGVSYLFDGDLSSDRSAADADAEITGANSGDGAGAALASAGDLDGDGYTDFVIGAPAAGVRDREVGAPGAGYMLLGPIGGDIDLDDADARWMGAEDGDLAGQALAGGADLDGDGEDDWLLGAPDAGGRGQVFLITSYAFGEWDLEDDAAGMIYSEDPSDGFGQALALVGDVDGDGMEDMLIGATGVDVGSGPSELADAGAVYLVPGGFYGSKDVSLMWSARFTGASKGALAGAAVAPAGDFNGDGEIDFLIGAPNHLRGGDRTGQAALILGGLADGTDRSLADAEGLFFGSDGDEVGAAVAGVGDLDGDGYDDVAVGAPGVSYDGGSDNGAVYLFYGGRTVSWSSPDLVIYGGDGDQLGASLAGPMDVDGDGYMDLVVGSPGSDAAYPGGGAVRIFLGTGQ